MSSVKKTTHPAVPMRLAMTGGAFDWQWGQRKCAGAFGCTSGWTGAGGGSVAHNGIPVKSFCGGGGA